MYGLYLKKHYLYSKWSVFTVILITTFLSAQPDKSFERVMIKPSKVELECGKKQLFTIVYKTGQHNPSSINYEVIIKLTYCKFHHHACLFDVYGNVFNIFANKILT